MLMNIAFRFRNRLNPFFQALVLSPDLKAYHFAYIFDFVINFIKYCQIKCVCVDIKVTYCII